MDNIKMDLREIGWGGMDWRLIWLRIGPVEGNAPSGSIKCWEIVE
jgi:hypothetical protein